jgi:hypothetical protein
VVAVGYFNSQFWVLRQDGGGLLPFGSRSSGGIMIFGDFAERFGNWDIALHFGAERDDDDDTPAGEDAANI